MMLRPGDPVRSTSGVEGKIAFPNSLVSEQKTVRLGQSETADTFLVVTKDGEVFRFLETALIRL